MISRVRRGVAAISVVLFLVLIVFTQRADTIILSNDVDLGSSNMGQSNPCGSVRVSPGTAVCRVFGAPRWIEHPRDGSLTGGVSGDDIDQVRVKITIEGRMLPPEWVALSVLEFPSLRPALGLNGPLQLVLEDPADLGRPFELKDFQVGYQDLKDFVGTLFPPRDVDLIFTVSAKFPNIPGSTATGTGTIAVFGAGKWVAVDVLGNGVAGSVATTDGVVPPRSMDLARALVRIEEQSGAQGVDFGAAGINRPVGFTHVFSVPTETRVLGATLQIALTANDPFFSTDYILLNDGVRHVAAGGPAAPVIAVSHVLQSPPDPDTGNRATVLIDLSQVPIMRDPPEPGVLFPQKPDAHRNLLDRLRDGRLNVIVTDDSTVLRSILTVYLRDRLQ